MPTRPITVTAEFTYEMEQGGFSLATFECRATADVRLGEPARPYHDDPGCGPEVEDFRDIEVEGVKYHRNAENGDRRWEKKWLKPHDSIRDMILAHLNTGAADWAFEDEAQDNAGPDPDMQREMRRVS